MVQSTGFLGFLALIMIALSFVPDSDGFVMGSKPLSKRSFFDIQCKGVYDKEIFSKLDRVCDDCYNLYREPGLHSLCRSKCFSTKYFRECAKVIMNEPLDYYQYLVSQIYAPSVSEETIAFRSNCFGSPYFKGCLDALLLNEDEGKYDEMIEILGKRK